MAGVTLRIPASRRMLMCDVNHEFEDSGESATMSLTDSVFSFLEDSGEGSPDSASSHGYGEQEGSDDDEEEEENSRNVEDDDKTFWEAQHQLLKDTLCRTSSLESRIRTATKEALNEAQLAGNFCVCGRPAADGCRNCLLREMCGRLQNAGFNSAICKSKWKSSPYIPSGEHTFLEVVDKYSSKNSKKLGVVRVVIELNFRAEFEVARASEEYNRLIRRLPQVFVGKFERLHNLIKILCSSAKKCMKENKMHMAPWRKYKYMQAKWLTTTFERTTPTATPLLSLASEEGCSSRVTVRPRTSMLTVDLLESLPNFRMTAVVM